MKKQIAILLAGAMILVPVLSGCGQTDNTAQADTQTSVSAQEETGAETDSSAEAESSAEEEVSGPAAEDVEAKVEPTDENGVALADVVYYSGMLSGAENGDADASELGNVISIQIDGDIMQINASFNTTDDPDADSENWTYADYDDYMFSISDECKYYSVGGDADPEEMTAEEFLNLCQQYNGLGLVLTVSDGVVMEAEVTS